GRIRLARRSKSNRAAVSPKGMPCAHAAHHSSQRKAPNDLTAPGRQKPDNGEVQALSLAAARARAFAASASRFFAGALVSSESSRCIAARATSSIARLKACSLALEGSLNPLIFRTNCREAARTSSSVTGGSKLNSVLIFLHIATTSA